MALETGTYISDLVATNPPGTDDRSTADDHLRLIKSTIKNTFPNLNGAMSATQAELNILDGAILSTTELNYVDGVTSSIQTQLSGKLIKNSNLSDLANTTTARSNLGLGGLATLGDVGQSELKTASGSVTSSLNTIVAKFILPGGTYGFYPQLKSSDATASRYNVAMAVTIDAATTSPTTSISIATSYASVITMAAASGFAITANQKYVTSSRPYDLGDGEVGLFIFAVINNSTGDIEALYSAPEAPWHYNGKTDIRSKLGVDGKKYRIRKDMSELPFTFESAMNDDIKMMEYISAFSSAPVIGELITQEIYQRDMVDIPHPFIGNDLTGKTIVMLNPISDLSHELRIMANDYDEFAVNDLLLNGYITIGNDDIGLVSPNGVLVPSFKWKNT